KIMTMWRMFKKIIDEGEASNELKSIMTIMNLIFSFCEDLPQFTIQLMFILQAVYGNDGEGVLDEISWFSVLTIVTSCLSLSKNYTEFSRIQSGYSAAPLLTFTTTLIAAGGRILVCCLLAIPTAFIRVLNDRHMESWWIVLPVASAIGVQIIVASSQFCLIILGKFIAHNCLLTKKNGDSFEFKEVYVHNESTSYSFDFISDVIKIRSNHEQSICQKLVNVIYVLGAGLRSLLFSVTTGAHSHLGLWSSAVYAMWSLLYKLTSLRIHVYRNLGGLHSQLSTTALTLTMLSYIINSMGVLINGKHRGTCIVVSLMFMIIPAYLYNSNALEYQYELRPKRGYGFRHGPGPRFDDTEIYLSLDEAFAIVYPIVTLAGLIICVNIIAVMIGIVRDRKADTEKKKMEEYFVQQMKNYNVNNETLNKSHTI
ncbi:unnamed protein product, partial [Meganyctiphanes norvegica]